MSTRDVLIITGNTILFLLFVTTIILLYNGRNNSITFVYVAGIMLTAVAFILLMNKYIYKKGTQLATKKDNARELMFTVDAQYKEVLVDIVWEIQVPPMQVVETSYVAVFTYPNGEIKKQDILVTNKALPNIPQQVEISTQINVYRKKGEQHIIKNPQTGTYTLKIETEKPYDGFKIKELTATAWN